MMKKLHIVLKITQKAHLNFWILVFSTNFCPIKNYLSGNTIWPQALGFQKLAKLTVFAILNELLSIQNVNVARFARNVECDFLGDFQTLWPIWCQFKFRLKNDFENGVKTVVMTSSARGKLQRISNQKKIGLRLQNSIF